MCRCLVWRASLQRPWRARTRAVAANAAELLMALAAGVVQGVGLLAALVAGAREDQRRGPVGVRQCLVRRQGATFALAPLASPPRLPA
jgi:hypothetical protein